MLSNQNGTNKFTVQSNQYSIQAACHLQLNTVQRITKSDTSTSATLFCKREQWSWCVIWADQFFSDQIILWLKIVHFLISLKRFLCFLHMFNAADASTITNYFRGYSTGKAELWQYSYNFNNIRTSHNTCTHLFYP